MVETKYSFIKIHINSDDDDNGFFSDTINKEKHKKEEIGKYCSIILIYEGVCFLGLSCDCAEFLQFDRITSCESAQNVCEF